MGENGSPKSRKFVGGSREGRIIEDRKNSNKPRRKCGGEGGAIGEIVFNEKGLSKNVEGLKGRRLESPSSWQKKG